MSAFAQCDPVTDPNCDPDGNPFDPDAPSVPIDGGVGFLLAAGVAYGLKKSGITRRIRKWRRLVNCLVAYLFKGTPLEFN